jgi:hypothetical protein
MGLLIAGLFIVRLLIKTHPDIVSMVAKEMSQPIIRSGVRVKVISTRFSPAVTGMVI